MRQLAMSNRVLLLAMAASASAQEIIIRFTPSPSPPPPPLSEAKANWNPLFFFLGLCGLYAFIMTLLLTQQYWIVCFQDGRNAESLPLTSSKSAASRPRSWMELQRAGAEPVPLEALDNQLKKGFVRKIYSILGTQLLLTVGICVGLLYASFYHGDPNYILKFGFYFLEQSWIVIVGLIVMMVCLCALFSLKDRHPYNLILLFTFTSLVSLLVARVIIVYYATGAGVNILLAFTVTAATFITLTLITMIAPVNWNFLQPFLFAGSMLLLFWAIFAPIFYCCGAHSSGLSLALGIIGTILFSGFIIYDTNNIMRYLGLDDYVIACVELYLDVINLFLCVLTIFSSTSN